MAISNTSASFRSAAKSSDKAIAECGQEPTELIAGFNKAKEYAKNQKVEKCETNTRLAKEEADFPPTLYSPGTMCASNDFKAMRICLTSR
jgi:hypothetical protein